MTQAVVAAPSHVSNRFGVQVKLLQFVRPQDFDNFRHFVRWRDTTANILLQILQRAAQVPASEDDKYGSWLVAQSNLRSSVVLPLYITVMFT